MTRSAVRSKVAAERLISRWTSRPVASLLIAGLLAAGPGADAVTASVHPLPSPSPSIANTVRHAAACQASKRGPQPVAARPLGSDLLRPAIIHALCAARRKAHADPFLLLAIAWQESRFDPTARNRSSSARGLLQFTAATWLRVIRDFGAEHGLGRLAAAIRTDQDGRVWVGRRAVRQKILKLRDNPELEAIMAAEQLDQQKATLEQQIGRKVTQADLYLLHLLGPAGAKDFLQRLAHSPDAWSIDVVGRVAEPNIGLFVRDGRKLTLMQTYRNVQQSLDEQVVLHAGLFAPAG